MKNEFENHIMRCCATKETNLRKTLKKLLSEVGFGTIIEDNYKSHRGEKYASVHNMLAIRGEPKVCLVAHTDCCRDHGNGNPTPVQPTIKEIDFGEGIIRRIIQDKDCRIQLGGDDRLGVAINTWITMNTNLPLALLFTTDEESGCCSSSEITHETFPQLKDYEFVLQTDRGNHSDQLVVDIGGVRLCSDEVAGTLLGIAKDIGLPRKPVRGLLTDVMVLRANKVVGNCCNMTVGYHNSIGSNPNEFIDIQEAYDTVKYVSAIVKHYENANQNPWVGGLIGETNGDGTNGQKPNI